MTTTANVTDSELARRVRVELDWNPRIAYSPGVKRVVNEVVVDPYA
jgi:hypothetical protein